MFTLLPLTSIVVGRPLSLSRRSRAFVLDIHVDVNRRGWATLLIRKELGGEHHIFTDTVLLLESGRQPENEEDQKQS